MSAITQWHYERCTVRPLKDCPIETDLGPEDSVSQVASCQGAMSTRSSRLLARQIDLDRRRAELGAIHARDLARAKATVYEEDRRRCRWSWRRG